MIKKFVLSSALIVFGWSGATNAIAGDGESAWLKYQKSQIPQERELVKVGAMRQEDLEFDIRLVSIGEAIAKATKERNTAEADTLNAQLVSTQQEKLAFDRQVGMKDVAEAAGAEEISAAAQRSMATDSRLPNGRPATVTVPVQNSNPGWCQQDASGQLVPCQ